MKPVKIAFLFVWITISYGCTTLTPAEKTEYNLMQNERVLIQEKNPATGGWLGLLPGGGAFYAREPGVGILDLLLWPLSVLWDPVVGFEMSKKVNYDLTVATLERKKSKELGELQNQRDLKQISDTDYVAKKREIEQRYDYYVKTQ